MDDKLSCQKWVYFEKKLHNVRDMSDRNGVLCQVPFKKSKNIFKATSFSELIDKISYTFQILEVI